MFRKKSKVRVYPNDITVFEPTKYLNILAVDMTGLTANAYQAAGLVLPGERFIDLHLNPYSRREELGIQAARRSLTMLADYITLHPDDIPPQQVYGLTHPRLGRIATHFGFEYTDVLPEKLPTALTERITGMMNGDVVAIHQSTEDLVDRFGSSDVGLGLPLVELG